MKLKEFKAIKFYIYNCIKPKNCRIIYCNDHIYGTHFNNKLKVCYITRNKHNSYISLIHSILHEICHYITWEQDWSRGQNGYYLNNKKWRPYKLNRYTAEYKAEKLLRNICRKYNWKEILKYSFSYVDETTEIIMDFRRKYKRWRDFNGYYYAAKRLQREELHYV